MLELGIPAGCSLHSKIVGHLAALN